MAVDDIDNKRFPLSTDTVHVELLLFNKFVDNRTFADGANDDATEGRFFAERSGKAERFRATEHLTCRA